MAKDTDHTVLGKDGELDLIRCENCGQVHRYTLPMSVDAWVKMIKDFQSLHKDCKPK